MTAGSPPSHRSHRRVTGSRTLADGENAPGERSEKLFGTVSEITPIGVKFKNRPNSRPQAAQDARCRRGAQGRGHGVRSPEPPVRQVPQGGNRPAVIGEAEGTVVNGDGTNLYDEDGALRYTRVPKATVGKTVYRCTRDALFGVTTRKCSLRRKCLRQPGAQARFRRRDAWRA
jgi:hypothetical protein